jgi:hypothetical protein
MSFLPQTERYTGYRTGLLSQVYTALAKYGNLPQEQRFVKECLSDPEICKLMDNTVINKLDEVGGISKLLLTVYSKYVSQKLFG